MTPRPCAPSVTWACYRFSPPSTVKLWSPRRCCGSLRRLPRFPALDRPQLPFVRVASPADHARVDELELRLERGEAEAIALALELKATALLIDEARGRALAARLGLAVVGTLGVLRDARTAGLIAAVRPHVERLVQEINFFLDPDLVREFLAQLGESAPA